MLTFDNEVRNEMKYIAMIFYIKSLYLYHTLNL